jgi:hypothetical protein
MSTILSVNCDDSHISMAMDDLSCPHCVWIEDNKAKCAKFYGNEWRVAGGTATALSSSNSLSISKHCLGFNAIGNPFFSILEGDDLVVVSWNGISWEKETAWAGVGSQDPIAWGVVWASAYVLIVITQNAGIKTIYAVDKSTGTWGTPIGIAIPEQDNIDSELKISKVASWVYAFWNGKNQTSGESWIGHASWDINGQTWVSQPSKKIERSIIEGDIGGIDFAVYNEMESSSSSTT